MKPLSINPMYGVVYTSQEGWTWAYGYARVSLRPAEFERTRTLTFRKEGGTDRSIMTPHTFPADVTREEVVAFIESILSTGRTLECGQGVGIRALGFDLPTSGTTEPWERLAEWAGAPPGGPDSALRTLNLNPDYQRGPVWDETRQRQFIGFALEGGQVPPLYVQRNEDIEEMEVIDGQQRLRAIARFIQGEIPGVVYQNGQRIELWYRDFNEIDRRNNRLTLTVIYGNWPRLERIRFYLRLNAGGVAHTETELDRVRALYLAEMEIR